MKTIHSCVTGTQIVVLHIKFRKKSLLIEEKKKVAGSSKDEWSGKTMNNLLCFIQKTFLLNIWRCDWKRGKKKSWWTNNGMERSTGI